jgi:import inner membrane translocase subunit TIM17
MNTVPCPGRIFNDLGDAFATGTALGTIWYFAKGAYYSVRKERVRGGIQLVANRAPILGGSFAMWGCIFSISNCCMVYLRNREDPINSVVAGFTTGFVLAIRGGIRNAMRSAIIGGLFLGIIEVIMVIYQQWDKKRQIVEQNKMIDKFKKESMRMQRLKTKRGLGSGDPNEDNIHRI